MQTNADIHHPLNPVYSVESEPKFRTETYTDDLLDENDNSFKCTISYDVRDCNGEKIIDKCGFDPMPPYYMSDESLKESVIESIFLAEGFVRFECQPERYEPKY